MLFEVFLFSDPIEVLVSILLHEVGHALGVTLFTKEKAQIYLGPANIITKKIFELEECTFISHGHSLIFVLLETEAISQALKVLCFQR